MPASRSWCAVSVTVVTLILLPKLGVDEPRAAAPFYVVTDLGTIGTIQSAHANDINDAGQVVGYAASRPFVWQDGTMTQLGTLGGNGAAALAINAFGQIVGYSNTTASANRAALWDNGSVTHLTPNLPPAEASVANGINDAGLVVGTINYTTAFLWDNGVLSTLPHLGGGGSHASDINNAGQIVGSSPIVTALGPMAHPALWHNDVVTDLGLLPGDEDGGASGINNAGQIVGSSGRTDPETYETFYKAFLYENGVMTALPVPSSESYAGDINESGVVVGSMSAWGGPSRYHAWVYMDGAVTNLNTLIPAGTGLHLAFANAINDSGQIVGVAVDSRGHYHAYLLTPVAAGTLAVNVGDAAVTEGHGGTRTATVAVTLSGAPTQPISVSYTTANGSAVAGADYQSASGTLTFDVGQTSKTIDVLVMGDRVGEANETFHLNLSNVSEGAVAADVQGAVTITDDEPRISIASVSRNEGHSGTTSFAFTVSLSSASDSAVSVSFATANGSARAAEDYTTQSGAVAFSAGQTSRTVSVAVRGDRTRESDEVFYVNLSGATGAFIASGQGTGVIRNDDR